ncbi:hypothetical protein Hanom_Chr02g00173991 [Helianthus anomalus]
MWKFVFLVMMLLTRMMPEEDSRGPTNHSVAIESASNIVPRSTRRRKRNAATTTVPNLGWYGRFSNFWVDMGIFFSLNESDRVY